LAEDTPPTLTSFSTTTTPAHRYDLWKKKEIKHTKPHTGKEDLVNKEEKVV